MSVEKRGNPMRPKEKQRKLNVAISWLMIALMVVPQALSPEVEARTTRLPSKLGGGATVGVKVRAVAPPVSKVHTSVSFPSNPTDDELSSVRVFLEPLIPLNTKPVPGENAALSRAIVAYRSRKDPDDVSAFVKFLTGFPASRWCA